MNERGIFIYQELANEIYNSINDNSHHYIQGGRSIGKTYFLNEIMRKFDNEKIYEGRKFESMIDLQRTITNIEVNDSELPNGPILIDDLDFFVLNYSISEEFKNVNFLTKLTNLALKNRIIIIATGIKNPFDLMQEVEDKLSSRSSPFEILTYQYWSDELSKWKIHQLSPMMSLTWERALAKNFHNELKIINPDFPRDESEYLFKNILELTGGYPLLWGAATSKIKEIVKMNIGYSNQIESKNIIKFLYLHVRNETSSIVKRSLRKLERNELIILNKIINDNDTFSFPEAHKLINYGFIRFDIDTGIFSIPGKILTTEIGNFFKYRRSLESNCSIIPDSENPLNNGMVTIKTLKDNISLEFKGSTWRILQHLFDANGKLVALDSLIEVGPFKNKTGVRSAIKRINEKVIANSLTPIIKNAHGEGYKFIYPKIIV